MGYASRLIAQVLQKIDPTRKKKLDEKEPTIEDAPSIPASLPATATPAMMESDKLIVLIAAALAAYGYGVSRIMALRPVGGQTWAQTARVEAVQSRNKMF